MICDSNEALTSSRSLFCPDASTGSSTAVSSTSPADRSSPSSSNGPSTTPAEILSDIFALDCDRKTG
ncbi:hypothetical protein GcM1_212022 [Golovinomyces cichoracearum]|uniref:Uncharacterized protein n=1 Tax=Golovinomyces cichoracearum TaxID=62708 RepID=A0A420IUS4_9PEZI|nr:hypothetical protein GcM1_212022 [Golovinomyces cichoracearum]